MESQSSHWTMDKRIPIALIVTMVLQAGSIVWWARGIQAEQEYLRENHERRLNTLESSRERERVGERLATLEAEMRNVSVVLERIDGRTERLVNGRGVR